MDFSNNASSVEDGPEQILYDVVTYREWEQEPELVKPTEKPVWPRKTGRWWGKVTGPVLPPGVEKLIGVKLPWHFAVSSDASLVAILQDNLLEVWSSRDNYNVLVGRCQVQRDPAPQWRHVVWAHDTSLLAVAYSSGCVEVHDTLAGLVYSIISPRLPATQPGYVDTPRTGPTSSSYAAVFFTNARVKDKKWISELVLVEFSGQVNSFLVSMSGYQEASSHHVGWSVTASVFCKNHNLMITAGQSPLAGKPKLTGRASQIGITAWRLLNDAPHYEPLMDEDEQSLLYKTSFRFPFSAPAPLDHVVRLSVSGCGRKLAAVHQSGTVSIWQLPGLTLESSTQLTAQPSYDEMNPALLQLPGRRRAKLEFLADPERYHPIDVGWWNPESVILARMSGAVSVLRVSDLSNLFGESPEFLEGVPSISQCFEKGFFGLECEQVIRGRRMTFDDSAGEDPDMELEEDSGDEDEDSWLTLGKRSAASIAYFLTDSERFAPPKKKARISRKTYRLLAFVSTTPEELYKRKIAAEEYGEAIMLAQHYKLDTDPVYERQWRMSTKSTVAIHDYLSKMKRRVTVFKECLETVPTEIDAAKELLVYGLKGTDLEAVLALSKRDNGELILCDGQRVMEQIWPADDLTTEEITDLLKEKEREARLRLMAQVNWQSMTLVQKDLIATRRKLLYYLDVLETYETILDKANDRFDPRVYRQLRKRTPLENCLRAARAGDCNTIMAMMGGCHADVTLSHWLPLVANFPETTQAAEYRELLPSLNLDGKVVPFFRTECRESDWCEQPVAVKWAGEGSSEEFSFIYEGQPHLQKYNTSVLTPGLISTWYHERAKTITKQTHLPALGLELLQLGLDRGLELDFSLLHRLRTLDTLVYEVQVDVELDRLQELSTIEQMKLIMSGCKDDTITAVRAWLLPFLQRLEDDEPGSLNKLIHTYCMERAETDLSFPTMVVDNSGPDKTGPILYDLTETVNLAIDCAYAHKTGAQIELLEQIYKSASSYVSHAGSKKRSRYILPKSMQERILVFREDLEASKILYRNGVVKPLSLFREYKNSTEAMTKLVVALARRAEGANPPLDQEGWRAVLRDLLSLQHQLPAISVQSVYQVYCESLLSSGSAANIILAGQEMHQVDDKVALVLSAWKHYYTSSLNLHDPTMDLARQVLCLIRPPTREIQDANDLIAALQSLSDFSITDVLPIAVLQSSNRLELAQMALNAKPTAYKNTQRLMKLASLLKIENPHDGGLEGLVWGLVAKKALDVGDFMAAHTACNNFIAAGYTEGWKICYALAATADFNDLDKCIDLLNFALTHCHDDNIEDVMRTLITVQQKSLHRNIAVKMEISAEVGSEDMDVFEDTLSDTGYDTSIPTAATNNVANQLLNVKRLSSQYLLENAVTQRVWQHTASWITQIADSTQLMQKSFHEDEILKTDFDLVRFPTFYIDLFIGEKVGFSALDLTYSSFSMPPRSSDTSLAGQQVLRIGLLSETMTVLTTNEPIEEVKRLVTKELLSQLVPIVISQDLFQGLGLLLAAHPDEAVPVLDNLPRTLPSISTTAAYFSIQLAAKYLSRRKKIAQEIFLVSPMDLIKLGLTLGATDDSSSCATWQRQLALYLELASDSQQAAQLAGLAGDVDVERFTLDNKYKEDTILGLAMYTDEENWTVTTGLARKYRIGMWTVMVTHLEAILVDTDLSTKEARELIEKRKLRETLGEDGEVCAKVMNERVLPLLDGRDIDRLLLYYDIMEIMADDDDAVKHTQALMKIKEKFLDIDYSVLSSGSSELSNILSQENVESIAEIVALIPNHHQTSSGSWVYKSWANKMFFQHGREKDNWIEAFSLIWRYLDYLSPSHFNELVNDCILSEQCLKLVPRPARGRIFKKALKFVEIKIAEKKVGNWKAVEDRLKLIKSHSEKFKSPIARDIISGTEDSHQKYLDKFELTGGEENKILKLISDMIVEDEKREAIKNIIKIWKQDPNDESETINSVMLQVVQLSADQMQTSASSHVITSPHLCIEILAEDWSLPVAQVSKLVSPLCTSHKVPIPQRLAFVKLLKNLTDNPDEGEGAMLAELYETQHDLENFLPGEEIHQSDLATQESRYTLFERILSKCSEPRQLMELGWLTTKWPQFADNIINSCEKNCFSRLLCKLIEQYPDVCSQFVIDIFKKIGTEELPDSVAKEFLEKCLEINKALYVHCALHLGNPEFHETVLEYVNEQAEVSDEVLQLLLLRGLGSRLMSTPLYPRLVAFARDTDSTTLGRLAGQMREAGHTPQAASLQMMADSVPVALRTMAAVARRLVKK